ncbi:asparagine synthetase A [Solwaraspora sp. WMMD406]|uniref:asparagine synthetase A n=1 Tax=Solwaraspora sp. WMMD406 TaxID=3016095 RepID=UPI002417309C|nr:asparagine synthetase A [Solwaraspora sp. WMMD406]MDG4763001.1 asparagine synthetase A [Solwaraspora sp. WMMD406]
MGAALAANRPPQKWHDPAAHFDPIMESPWYRMITAINAAIVEATAAFYQRRGIVPALMPITVSSVSSPMGLGSDSLPVRVNLLGRETYLADSMQFQLEFMLRHGLNGAYYIMPTFRGEEPNATHLNQFFHSEAEITGGLADVMTLVEAYLRALTASVVASPACEAVVEAVGGLDHLQPLRNESPVPSIDFESAAELLGESAFTVREQGILTITRKGERTLLEHFGGAVWLTHPPCASVPFYQRSDAQGRAMSADLLLGCGEVVGCGERWTTGAEVRRALADHLVDEDDYRWYVDMKDRLPMQTAGFGLGIERFLMWLLQHDDIRDLQVMPRIKGQESWV